MGSFAELFNSTTMYSELRGDVGSFSDKMLVESAQAGEYWAFVELCKRNSKKVFNAIYRVTKNREDAEDALQDSVLSAFVHLKKFDGRSSFSTWFHRIGINSALIILRRKRVRSEIPMGDSGDNSQSWPQWEVPDNSPDPEQQYLRHERTEQLSRAIQRLPLPYRAVVEVQTATEGSQKELADHLGVTVPAIKSRLHRAKAALREALV